MYGRFRGDNELLGPRYVVVCEWKSGSPERPLVHLTGMLPYAEVSGMADDMEIGRSPRKYPVWDTDTDGNRTGV